MNIETIELEKMSEQSTDSKPKIWVPKDGGAVAWCTLAAACITNGVVLGFWNDNSVIYAALLDHNVDSGEANLAFKMSIVVSLCAGMIFVMAPFGGILVDWKGYRITAFTGAFIGAISLLTSSRLLHVAPALYVTFLIFGAGTSLIQVSSIAILGMHFRNRLGLVNGLVASSSSVFGTIFPQCMKLLLRHYGLPGLLRVFTAGFILVAALAAYAYKIPREAPAPKRRGFQPMNKDIWRNKKYIIWCITCGMIWFGYFVPFIHILKYALLKFPNEDTYILSMSLNLPGIVSRLGFGALSDLTAVHTGVLQQIAFLSMGICTILVPVVESWPLAIVVTLGIGMMSGGAWSLLGPVGTQLCGPVGAPQALGFMFGIGSLPLIVGTSLAGLLYDQSGSYEVSFYIAGTSIITGSILMSIMHCVK